MQDKAITIEEKEFLILVKDEIKSNAFSYRVLDATSIEIVYTIQQNERKAFTYKKENVKILDEPLLVDLNLYSFGNKDKDFTNIEKVLSFNNEYFKIFFKDFRKIYKVSELNIKKNALTNEKSKEIFSYFSSISKITHKYAYIQDLLARNKITKEEIPSSSLEEIIEKYPLEEKEQRQSIPAKSLANQFEKLDFIDDTTVASLYLDPSRATANLNTKEDIIFPFGCNSSQMSAVENAINNHVSIIEGPPGTGKTQTILNIIANILLENKSLAVVSNNNSATDNVFEKLEKNNLAYLAAQLGNAENKNYFFLNKQTKYPDFTPDIIKIDPFFELRSALISQKNELKSMLEKQNRNAVLVTQLADLELEIYYYTQYFTENNLVEFDIFRNPKKLSSNEISAYSFLLQNKFENKKKISLFFKLISFFIHSIKTISIFNHTNEEITANLQMTFYQRKKEEMQKELTKNQEELEAFSFQEKLNSFTADSLKYLKAHLASKYHKEEEREVFDQSNLKTTDFIAEYPIVLSSTSSIRNSLKNCVYDYLIIDEASQVGLDTGFLSFTCARKVIIVGDLKQLPNILDSYCLDEYNALAHKNNIPPDYQFVNNNSLLSSSSKVFTHAPSTLLCEHYRCHPKIINFCNKRFYHNELVIMTKDNQEKDVLKVYITAKGNHAVNNVNLRQIEEIEKVILPELNSEDVGIIAPYRNQVHKLETTFNTSNPNKKLEIATVHKFQGRENDDIILTTVDNQITEFTANANMLNVAVSRAKKRLYLVVSNNEKNYDTNIGDLIKYIRYNSFEIVNSNLYSVFDMLYKANEEARQNFLADKKRVSKHDSENLMHALIEKVLSAEKFSHLAVCVHTPLQKIFRNLEIVRNDVHKYNFIKNPFSHVDFMIYSIIDKSYILAIEVDGYAFHNEKTDQHKRDLLKDDIFKAYNLPLVRFSTKGSQEESILYNTLSSICNPND